MIKFLSVSLVLVMVIGYIYNLVWLFDNWHTMETFTKGLNILGATFVPPLGSILGAYHFFI